MTKEQYQRACEINARLQQLQQVKKGNTRNCHKALNLYA